MYTCLKMHMYMQILNGLDDFQNARSEHPDRKFQRVQPAVGLEFCSTCPLSEMKSMGSVSELDPKYFRTKNGQAIQGHFEVISGHCFAFQSEALFDPAFFQNQELLEFKSI